MKTFFKHLSNNLPHYISLAILVLNGLEASGAIDLSSKLVLIINGVLIPFGISTVAIRQGE